MMWAIFIATFGLTLAALIIKNNGLIVKTNDKCYKCGSTSLSLTQRGFSLAKGAAGGLVAGYIGMLAGCIGSKKPMVECDCCGTRWKYRQPDL